MSSLSLPQANSPLLRLSDLLLLLVALVWGSSYGVAKGALLFYPVLGLLSLRFLLTFTLLLPALWRASRSQSRDALRSGLPLGALMLSIFLCETFGVALTQASNAAFLISLCVVFTPFVEWWLLGRRPAPALFGFAAVSLLGAALLGGGPSFRLGVGDALMLGAAALRALTVCLTAKLNRSNNSASALALTAVQAGVIGFGSLLLAWALAPRLGDLPALPGQPAFWWAIAYLVLGCSVFAFFAQNWALQRSSPSRVALLTGSEPAFGALFAVFWLGESLTLTARLGGALIVAAALWTGLRRG